jgi:hypothetical protein
MRASAHAIPIPARSLPLVWVVLLLMTLMSYFALGQFSGTGYVLLVLAAMLIKGQLLVDHFMGLRQVHWLWRGLMALYLFGLTSAIGLAFLLD